MSYDIGARIMLEGEKEFRNALKQINAGLRVNDSELKLVAAQYGKTSDSMESLTAKNAALEKAILSQKEKLGALSQGIEISAKKYGEASTRTMNLQVQYNKAATEVEKLTQEYKENSKKIDDISGKTKGFNQTLGNLKNALKEGGDAAKDMSEKLKGIGQSIQGAGRALSVGITAPLLALGAAATKGTEDLRIDLSKLETNAKLAGNSINSIDESMAKLNAVTGETDSNVEALSNLMQVGFTDNQMKTALDALSGAVIAFPDTLKIEGLADGLQETLATGKAVGPFAELLDRTGINLERFEKGLARAKKAGEEQNYALQTLAKTGLTETYYAYLNNNKVMIENREAQYRLKKALSELGEALTPILTQISELAKGVLDWFNSLSSVEQKTVITIAGILAATGPLLVGIGQITMGLGSLLGNMDKIKAAGVAVKSAIGLIANPMVLAVAAIAGVVVAIAYLYENCEGFRDGVQAIFKGIANFFSEFIKGIKEGIQTIIDSYKAIPRHIKSALESAKNAVVSKFNEGLDWVKKKIKDIQKFFKELPQKLKEIGTNIMNGLWEGIKSKFTEIKNGISNFFSGIIKGVKNTLGIKSPSKVFAEIGQNMAAGIDVGFNKSMGNVSRKINNAVSPARTSAPALAVAGSSSRSVATYDHRQYNLNVQRIDDLNQMLDWWDNKRMRGRG